MVYFPKKTIKRQKSWYIDFSVLLYIYNIYQNINIDNIKPDSIYIVLIKIIKYRRLTKIFE